MSSLKLTQIATYWTVASRTSTGGKTYNKGIKISARIADSSEVMFTKEGKQFKAKRVFYSTVKFLEESYIDEGDHSALGSTLSSDAQQVMIVKTNSSMSDLQKAVT